MRREHEKHLKAPPTHIVLMQDLKHSVDIVERVNSGGASLFGLRNRKNNKEVAHSSVFIIIKLQESKTDSIKKKKKNQLFLLLFALATHAVLCSFQRMKMWIYQSQTSILNESYFFSAGQKDAEIQSYGGETDIITQSFTAYIHHTYYPISKVHRPTYGRNGMKNSCQLEISLKSSHTSTTH